MITRIVRMEFDPNRTTAFEELFIANKEKIRNQKGCTYLSLHQDHHQLNVYYTISNWESQEDLDAYRSTALFETIWSKTKVLFAGKPQAYSLNKLVELG